MTVSTNQIEVFILLANHKALFINDKKVASFIQRVWRWENQKWMGLMILVRASRTDFQDAKPVLGIWMIVRVISDILNLPVQCFMLDFWIKLSEYYVVYVTTAQNYWSISTIQRWLISCRSQLVSSFEVRSVSIQSVYESYNMSHLIWHMCTGRADLNCLHYQVFLKLKSLYLRQLRIYR